MPHQRTFPLRAVVIAGITVGIAVFALLYFFLSPPQPGAAAERFVVPQNATREEAIASLASAGFVKSSFFFNLLAHAEGLTISPGGYKLAKSMNAFHVADALRAGPYMAWVTVPPGMRKEEIANMLSSSLGWSDATKAEFLGAYQTLGGNDYKEGVYFPDTYLLPKTEDGVQIAQRFITHFDEQFAPYAAAAAKQNVKWTTALKVASLIQREAAGPHTSGGVGAGDMALISGIIWNRLLRGMKLDIDATVEYARGDKGVGYWAPLKAGDTKIDSPFNTYLHKGLPPAPIANPGIPAINAALHEASTTCLYYLHDAQRQIHCANTYAEHEANIEKYLK